MEYRARQFFAEKCYRRMEQTLQRGLKMAQDFKFFASYLDAASELSEKDCKDFVYAIVQYGINGIELPLKKSMKPMWILVKPTLDSSRKLHEYGKNGGRPKKPPFQESKSPFPKMKKPLKNPLFLWIRIRKRNMD